MKLKRTLGRLATLKRQTIALSFGFLLMVGIIGSALAVDSAHAISGPGGVANPGQAAIEAQQAAEAESAAAASSSTNCAQSDNFEKCLRQFLRSIKSRSDAQFAFLGSVNEDNPSDLDKVDFQGPNGSPDDNSDFVAASRASIGSKYDGNPFFSLNTNQIMRQPQDPHQPVISGDDTGKVRFVLTEVVYAHQPDVEGIAGRDGGDESNVYIFRNEYNPSLAIAFRTITAAIGTSAAEASDDKHFVYYRGCNTEIMGDDAWVADVESSDPDWFTDEDEREKVEDSIESFSNVRICDTNNSIFASAMRSALTAISDAISGIYEWIKDALLNVFDIGTLTDNAGLTKAWKTIRDFVNLIFVILLSVVAMSNILRIDTERYGVRALLPRLIFAVIAVNFSFLMVQIMSNVAFIISQPFVEKSFELISDPPIDPSSLNPAEAIGTFIIILLMLVAVIIGFIILFVFFVTRILVVWMLAALSPFVFLLMVLPLTRNLANQWWKNAFKWIFMGPIAFVILYIAAEMLSAINTGKSDDVSGPDFLLAVAFFVAAAIAAVMIPLKLGGEIMQRGANAAKGGGKFGGRFAAGAGVAAAGGSKNPLKFGKQGSAYLEQRKANQEQDARLGAIASQGRMAQIPGVGGILTGGSRGTVASQQAAMESKYAKDIDDMGIDTGSQRMIATGDEAGLREAGLDRAADLAKTGVGQRAAARLLAQQGSLNHSTLMNDKGTRDNLIASGAHAKMKGANPVLGNMTNEGTWTAASLGAIEAQASSSSAGSIKDMHWSDVEKSLKSGDETEREAAKTLLEHLSPDALKSNFLEGDRNFIDSNSEREALSKSLRAIGHAPPPLRRKSDRPGPDTETGPKPTDQTSKGGVVLPPGVEDDRK